MRILIDNHEVELPDDRRMNAIEAGRLVGSKVPHYCWHPGLTVVGSCRMCLIEVGQRDPKSGKITMQPKLVPGCATIVSDNMVLVTQSEKVAHARAMVEEDLLLRHPIDCPICDKAGECKLQDYHFEYGQGARRADLRPFTSRRRDIGDITLFVDRCVLCSRCVRFTAEISGTYELMFNGRGTHEEIDVVAGFPLNNKLSGNVVDLCPVGALGDKDFLYKQRVWYLKRHRVVCTCCATGCSIWIEENQDRVYRIKPRENRFVNQWWICNDGRYEYPHIHDPRRLTQPMGRGDGGVRDTLSNIQLPNGPHPSPLPKGEGTRSINLAKGEGTRSINLPKKAGTGRTSLPEGEGAVAVDWSVLPQTLLAELRGAGRLAAVISPFVTVEEAYLLCKLIRGIDREALLAMGPVPVIGEDERFPKGFRISAEKCPNRRGVEAIISHFAHRSLSFDDLLAEIDRGAVQGAWVAGGYKEPWVDEATARRFEKLKLLVVQDLFPSPLSERATYVLPGAAYAERDGSYVNRVDRLQSAPWAIRPPLGVRTDGSLLWEMSGRKGLYSARTVLEEIARECLFFSAINGPVPETGIDLRGNLLAEKNWATQGLS